MPLSDKLGSFGPWNWLIDMRPATAFIMMMILSPVMIAYIIRPLVEGKINRFSDDFLTFRADVLFAPAFMCGITLVQDISGTCHVPMWVQVLILAFWLVFGGFHMWQERHAYHWSQTLSPSALYHNGFLYGFLGYAMTMVCGAGVFCAPWTAANILLRVVILLCIACWALCWPLHDARHKQNTAGECKFELSHPTDGWPWQHGYKYLATDWRNYLDGWRSLLRRF